MMQMVKLCTASLLVVAALVASGCSGDDEKPMDSGPGDIVDIGVTPDTVGSVEAFGKLCTNIGQTCKDKSTSGYVLWCVALTGGSTGKGFCTPTCSAVGNECFQVPNGQMASCFIGTAAGADAGTATKYCGFLCKSQGKTWTCPGELTCGKVDAQGTAVCLQ